MIALAIGLLSQMNDLESVVYDSFQRYQYRSASSEILLLTVDSRTETQKDIWSDHGFAQLTEILRGYGARLIVATQPLALSQVPDEDQVRALIKLQEQAQRSGSHDLKMSGQLNIFRDRFDEREALINQLQKAQNVVLTAYTTSFEGTGSNPQNCVAHEINLQGTDDESLTAVRRVRFLATPPERVCDSASAIGFGNFYPDRDGVVRSAELFVNADNVFLPSLALAAASAGDNHNIIIASPNTFSLRDHITHTGKGFQILNRYYNGRLDEPAFQTATVSAVLNRQIDPAQVKGRIVLVGETVNDDMPGIKTPVSTKMPPMEVVATSLSNLLDGDYLLPNLAIPDGNRPTARGAADCAAVDARDAQCRCCPRRPATGNLATQHRGLFAGLRRNLAAVSDDGRICRSCGLDHAFLERAKAAAAAHAARIARCGHPPKDAGRTSRNRPGVLGIASTGADRADETKDVRNRYHSRARQGVRMRRTRTLTYRED
jgi:CHASE2 domain-containing sensor protein